MAQPHLLPPFSARLLLSIFLLILNLSLPTTTIAFASFPCCPSKSRNHYCINTQQGPLKLKLPILEATKTVQDSVISRRWYPDEELDDKSREDLEEQSLELVTELVRQLLPYDTYVVGDADRKEETEDDGEDIENENNNKSGANQKAYEMARGRFVDFCGDRDGEELLESLFLRTGETVIGKSLLAEEKNDDEFIRYRKVVEGSIISLQSLLALGITYGLTMNPMGVSQAVAHMKEDAEALDMTDTIQRQQWTPAHSLRLKYRAISDNNADEKIAGLQILSALKFKRTPLGAYNLLVRIGVWGKHENLALLRSGFPVRFTASEEDVANRVATESNENESGKDPDNALGIRRDFRSQKIYTIDSASTKEIDDGLGVEIINGSENSEKRYRYWIHIADADRWAPRKSELFEIARRRATSIYLPGTSIPMMPSSVSQQVMSLKAQTDVCALSLGVELNDDGSIIDDSIIVTPSTVRVDYRLTYDEADEMLEDGVGYSEEWELGQLYSGAQQRRQFRMDNGSAEAFVPTQIPQYTISTFHDQSAPDGVGIKVDIQVSHNGGKNQSAIVADSMIGGNEDSDLSNELPVSSASTLVTEMMILAGEAIGKWAMRETKMLNDIEKSNNSLELPFRSQDKPDYRSREREREIMMDLLEHNIGDGYCHAWYSRRFLTPAKISPDANPHSGLGLGCYVQWTSPIRRFQDLQVHATVKRFIRRQKVINLLNNGEEVPTGITSEDLGCELASLSKDGKSELNTEDIDSDIDYSDKIKLLKPAQFVMRNSNKFWMLENIRRIKETDPQRTLEVLVCGCINPTKRQYAVFIYELGLEWRYNSPVGIQAGDRFKARIGNVLPQNGQMTLVRVPNGL
jgi:exoribonuclease-2